MSRTSLYLVLLACVLVAARCSKKTDDAPQPVITVTAPTAAQHFADGDSIHIRGNVTHSLALTEVAVHMTETAGNNEFFHNHYLVTPGSTSFAFDAVYKVPDNKKNTFKVEVEATDKNGTEAKKEFSISIN